MKRYITFLLALLMLTTMAACRRKASALSEYYAPDTQVAATAEPIPGIEDTGETAEFPTDSTIDLTVQDAEAIDNAIDAAVTPAPTAVTISPNPETSNAAAPTTVPDTDTPADVEPTDETPAPEATEKPVVGHIPNSTAYEQYNNMSGSDQLAFIESFDSTEAFVAWYNAAKAEYNASNPPIEITGDVIDLGELG